jgi:3-hydroxybutyryl-CoA dehydrogenase
MNLAVIGAGTQGRAFALACARVGFHVVLEDVMPEKLRRAQADFSSLGAAVRLVSTVEDAVTEADLVIDFVPDELESKLEIWSLLDRMAPPRTILCTPSAALSITDLASCTYRPDRAIMVRGDLLTRELVSLLSAAQTTEQTRSLAARIFTALGHQINQSPDPDLPQLLKNMNAPTLV